MTINYPTRPPFLFRPPNPDLLAVILRQQLFFRPQPPCSEPSYCPPMIFFSSWDRASHRVENPPPTPISKIAISMFKGFKVRQRNRECGNPQTSAKLKKSIVNPPNRPEIRVLSLVSHIPVGTPRDPPPLPPKALGTSLCIPGSKFNLRQHAGQHQQMPSESETNISRRIFSSTPPFRDVEPRIADNNRAHIPLEATITPHGTAHQNLQRISRTDVVLSLVEGAALAKTTPLGKHGLAVNAGSDTGAQSSAVLSQSDSPLSIHSLSSPNPTALEVGDWPNPPQPLSIHPPIGPSSLPVTTSSIYEGGISTSGAAEQEGDVPPPQDDDTPRLESGPSVGSFVGLRSRWSSTANDSTEEEEPPSFLQRFKFRYRKKANRDLQTSGKTKQSSKNEATAFRDWTLPSFLRSTGSSRNPSLPLPTDLGPSQSASALNRPIYQNDRETSPMDSNSSPVISAVIVKTAGPIRTRGAPVDPNEDNSPQYSVVLSHANGLFSAHPIPFK